MGCVLLNRVPCTLLGWALAVCRDILFPLAVHVVFVW